jgi:hypothetical protein
MMDQLGPADSHRGNFRPEQMRVRAGPLGHAMNFCRIHFSASLVFQNDVAEGGWVTKIHVENPNIFAKRKGRGPARAP